MSPILALGMPGWPEITFILILAFLLFGAKRLPELARGLGQSIGEFKKARDEFERELHRSVQTETPPQPVAPAQPAIQEPTDKQPHTPA